MTPTFAPAPTVPPQRAADTTYLPHMGVEGLLELLIYLLIAGVIFYGVVWAINMLALPRPARMLVMLIVAVGVLIFLLRTFGLLL